MAVAVEHSTKTAGPCQTASATPARRVLKGGTVIFNGRRSTFPCVIRELSEDGARLEVQQGICLPDRFDLLIDLDGVEVACDVVWRKAFSVGVRFAAAQPSARTPSPAPSPAAPLAPPQPDGLRPRPMHPASPSEASTRPRSGAATMPGSAPIHILVADDDADDRFLLQSAFEEQCFACTFAFVENGVELLAYLKKEAPFEEAPTPGLVLLDLNMPRMDGRRALKHIRSYSAMRRLPVIVLSDSADENDIDQAYELGVSGYFPKPGSAQDTIDLIQTISMYWQRVSAPLRR